MDSNDEYCLLSKTPETQRSQVSRADLDNLRVEELLHELRTHQIELEMQNEQLRLTQASLEESRKRYVDLYDFAPVGYVLLSEQGIVIEANQTAAKLLGFDRSKFLSSRFSHFATPKDVDRWHLFFYKLIKYKLELNTELSLKKGQGSELPVQLTCLYINSTVRISITDVSNIKNAEAASGEAETRNTINAERLRLQRYMKIY